MHFEERREDILAQTVGQQTNRDYPSL